MVHKPTYGPLAYISTIWKIHRAGMAVKRQKAKTEKNQYFDIFGLENSFFEKLLDSCTSERDLDP